MEVIKVIKSHGYNQTQVADMIGTSKGNLSRSIKQGPTVSMLHRIATAIGADYNEFFEDELVLPPSKPTKAGEVTVAGKRYKLVPVE